MNEKKRYIVALCIGLNMALGSAIAMAENEHNVKPQDEQVAAAESPNAAEPKTNSRDALKPFKYTIITSDIIYDDEHPRWEPLYPLKDENEDPQFIVPVSVHKVDKEDVIDYDLDCDGDGVFEFTGLNKSQVCVYERDSGKHQIAVRGSIPSMTLCTLQYHALYERARKEAYRLSEKDLKQSKPSANANTHKNIYKIWGNSRLNLLIKTVGILAVMPNALTTTAEMITDLYRDHLLKKKVLKNTFEQLISGKRIDSLKRDGVAIAVIGTMSIVEDLSWRMVDSALEYTYHYLAKIMDNQNNKIQPESGDDEQADNEDNVLQADDDDNVLSGKLNPFYVVSIDDWGDIQWKSMNTFAEDCVLLADIPVEAPDLSHVRDISYMFKDAHRFNFPVEHWDVSNVTNMAHLFDSAYDFNQSLLGWDVSNVKNMAGMFKRAFAFNQNIESWDVSNVTNMSSMFMGDAGYSEYDDEFQYMEFNKPLEGWNVSNVTNMADMFRYNSRFNQPLGKWDVSSVKDMSGMFGSTFSFDQPIENWDVSSVENMAEMFSEEYKYCNYNCSYFNQPIGKWDVSHVTNMSGMFYNNSEFNQPLNQWDVSKVEKIDRMFLWADSFNQSLDRWNLASVKESRDFIKSWWIPHYIDIWCQKWNQLDLCTELKDPKRPKVEFNSKPFKYTITTDIRPNLLSGMDVVEIPIIVYDITTDLCYSYCDLSYDDSAECIDACKLRQYPMYDLDCDGDGDYEFKGLQTSHRCVYPKNSGKHQIWLRGRIPGIFLCSNFMDISNIYHLMYKPYTMVEPNAYLLREAVISIDDWGDIEWLSMLMMAANCIALKSIPKEAPNLSYTLDMKYMFYGATYFNLPIGHWDVSNVREMEGMFYGATHFNQPLDSWNVSKVHRMVDMFRGARHFNQPLGNWNVSNVNTMENMFKDAVLFNQPIGSWDVSHVNDMVGMFSNAYSFNQSLGNWDVSHVNDMVGMFSNAYSFNQPLGNWDVSHVHNMRGMFSDAYSFNQPLGNWDVSQVNYMDGMFSNARSFNQPIGNWNVSNVSSMNRMFENTRDFNQPIGTWNVSHVIYMEGMFRGAQAFNQSLNAWNVSQVTNMAWMFANTKLFNQPLASWDVSKVNDMRGMFYCSHAFNHPLASWDLSHVENKSGMLGDAKAFKQSTTNWDEDSNSVVTIQDGDYRWKACADSLVGGKSDDYRYYHHYGNCPCEGSDNTDDETDYMNDEED